MKHKGRVFTFAVESLRRWWRGDGALEYPQARQILVCASNGGSNGYRLRLWKYELGRWATETGLPVNVPFASGHQ